MKTIYKYPIEYDSDRNVVYIKVPKGAIVTSVLNLDMEALSGYVYAMVDPTIEPTVKREVLWLGTGWHFTPEQEEKVKNYQFLGTHKDVNGFFVWHLWVEKEKVEMEEEDFVVDTFNVEIDPKTNKIINIKYS